MGFFSNLFRGRSTKRPAEPAPAPAPEDKDEGQDEVTLPARMEFEPGFTVQIDSHPDTPAGVALWSFVSDGLRAHGQREIVITILRRRDEPEHAFPRQVLGLLRTIHRFAREGQIVVPGALTEFGPEGFLEPRLRALVYADAQPLEGVELPDDALTAILIDEDELAVVKRCGAYRVLGRLGKQHTRFPFPPWSDRDRETVARGRREAESALHKIGVVVNLADVSLVMDEQRIRMQILRSAGKGVAAMLDEALGNAPPDTAFVMFSQPASNAHGRLVWFPGQTHAFAITGPEPSPRTISGNFLVVTVFDGELAEQAIGVEDGFFLVLRTATWAALKRAIASGDAFALPAKPGDLAFELTWIEHDYKNPFDGTVLHASGGWQTYEGRGAAENTRSKVVLMGSNRDLNAAIEASVLADYVKRLGDCLERAVPATRAKTTATLQVELARDRGPVVQLRFDPGAPASELRDELAGVAAPAVRGPIAFQLITQLGYDA
jgi:hypothetical protein